jgi:CubicO group peptidase (beta-lactamase class C family)
MCNQSDSGLLAATQLSDPPIQSAESPSRRRPHVSRPPQPIVLTLACTPRRLGVDISVKGSPTRPQGEAGWGGLFSTNWYIVPSLDTAVVLMTQKAPSSGSLGKVVKSGFYGALAGDARGRRALRSRSL